ncbi:MAG TPA: hypothetical protein DDW89_09035, partial [Gammaproteobacteria bacterium]|nr:hypothetical protein [Gammaproteobacteria bacterium]
MTIDITTLRLGDTVTTTDGVTGRVCEITETGSGDGRGARYFIGLARPDGVSDRRVLCHRDGSTASTTGSAVGVSSISHLAPAVVPGQPQGRADTVTVPIADLIRLLSECNRLIGRHSWDKTAPMAPLVSAV